MMSGLREKVREMGLNLDVVRLITVIEGLLVNEGPLRVGRPGGGLGDAVDLPIERLPLGTPYIPGSSLKGALRSLAERLVATEGRPVCDVFADLNECEAAILVARGLVKGWSLGEVREALVGRVNRAGRVAPGVNRVVELLSSEASPEGVVEKLKLWGLPCPVCRLFGNKELASHVLVSDAVPEVDPHVGYRTRVAIDRFRRAARSGALFDYEYVSPGVEWRFRVKAYNVAIGEGDDPSRLLRSIMDYVKDLGLEVGGMKSTGHGRLRLKRAEIKAYEVKDFRLIERGRVEVGGHGV